MYVSDVIADDFKLWRGGDSVFVETPTGTGKTTFILERLWPYFKSQGGEVLYLSNRFLLKEQIKVKIAEMQGLPTEDREWLEMVEEFDGITVMSYQKLQRRVKLADYRYDKARYLCVIFDEIHYLIEDAAFNPETFYLLEFLRECTGINVFLSATMDEARDIIIQRRYGNNVLWDTMRSKNEFLSRCLVDNFVGRIHGVYPTIWFYEWSRRKGKNFSVKYFTEYSEITSLINSDLTGEKWLLFVSNKEKARVLLSSIRQDVKMICAEECDNEVIDDLTRKEKFSSKILITTKILDNGVTIKDSDLKHIVIDTISRTEFLQMLGRKREVGDETFEVFLPKKTRKFFAGYAQLNLAGAKKLVHAEPDTNRLINMMLSDTAVLELVKRFCIWKSGRFIINPMAQIYIENLWEFVTKMQRRMEEDEWAFVKEQLNWIGMEDMFDKRSDLTAQMKKAALDDLEIYLTDIEGEELDKGGQEKLRKRIFEWGKSAKIPLTSASRVPGKAVLNKFFVENQVPFVIKSRKSQKKGRSPNG